MLVVYNIAMMLLGGLVTKIILVMLLKIYPNNKGCGMNYRKQMIPASVGIVFMLTLLLMSLILSIGLYTQWSQIIVAGVVGFGILGIIDDLVGDKEFQGFRGHIYALLRGQVTTGMIKAIGGGLLSIYISFLLFEEIGDIILHSLLIGCATNLMNLLDVRPGRACKGFVFLIILGSLSVDQIYVRILGYVSIIMVLVYVEGDLKGEYMMGDIGANILGFIVGVSFASMENIYFKVIMLFIFAALNLISEKISFSEIIDNNKILYQIDQWKRE